MAHRRERTPGQLAAYELGRQLYRNRNNETRTVRREIHYKPDGTVVLVEEQSITTSEG